jgi:hypothetical protein
MKSTEVKLTGDKYAKIRELLTKYHFNLTPEYSGYGLEIYENSIQWQMIVNWDTDIAIIKEGNIDE